MSRIRTIKPEFPQSETIGKLSREARLLFIQLWTLADDDGRTRAASRMLASFLYPYDDDAPGLIDGWLAELQENECVRLYRIDGTSYLEIINWLKHQKIDRPSPSKLPAFREGSTIIRETSRGLDADLVPSTKDLGSYIPEAPTELLPLTGREEKKSKSGMRLPQDWVPSERSIEICIAMGYSREFLLGEGLDGFRGYWCPLPGRKAHKLDWDQTYCNRMRERVDRGRLTGQARAGPRQEPLFKNPYIAVMAEKHGISTHEHREASNITIDADPAESAGASHDRQLAFSDPVSEGGKLARFYSRNADKR